MYPSVLFMSRDMSGVSCSRVLSVSIMSKMRRWAHPYTLPPSNPILLVSPRGTQATCPACSRL